MTTPSDELLEQACEKFRDAEIAHLRAGGKHAYGECACSSGGHVPPVGFINNNGRCTRCGSQYQAGTDALGGYAPCPNCLTGVDPPLHRWPDLKEVVRKQVRELLRPVVDAVHNHDAGNDLIITTQDVDQAVRREREACAKLVEAHAAHAFRGVCGHDIAAEIRAKKT